MNPYSWKFSVKLEIDSFKEFDNLDMQPEYLELKGLYDKKIAANLGLTQKYKITRKISDLIKNSFELSAEYAAFDFKFEKIKNLASNLEEKIHTIQKR